MPERRARENDGFLENRGRSRGERRGTERVGPASERDRPRDGGSLGRAHAPPEAQPRAGLVRLAPQAGLLRKERQGRVSDRGRAQERQLEAESDRAGPQEAAQQVQQVGERRLELGRGGGGERSARQRAAARQVGPRRDRRPREAARRVARRGRARAPRRLAGGPGRNGKDHARQAGDLILFSDGNEIVIAR